MSSKGKHRDDGEFFLECKAAFLSIYDDINDRVESKKALNTLLQQSGRNPTRVSLNKYWPGDTDQLSFDEYVDICRNEPVTSADDLMKAFRKIDINGDGYISLDELYKIMNGQGEKMSRDDVRKMIDEVDENKDGQLDYGEFTNMIMKTTEESKKFTKKVMEKKERRKNRTEKSRFSAFTDQTECSTSHIEENKAHKSTELGSKASLKLSQNEVDRSQSHVSDEDGDIYPLVKSKISQNKQSPFGSQTSLQTSKAETVKSNHGTLFGSKTSLRSVESKSQKFHEIENLDTNFGSRVSIRSTSKELNKAGSSSITQEEKSRQGSLVSIRSVRTEDHVGLGSRTSLRSFKATANGSQENILGIDSSKQRPGSASSQRSSLSQKHDEQNSARSRDGPHRDSYRLETSPKRDTPRSSRFDSPTSPKMTKHDSDTDTLSVRAGHNSARTVGEEIDYDDDFDIVSTGRPTPRVDLNTPVNKTPRKDDSKSARSNMGSRSSLRDEKGNSSQKLVATSAKANTSDDKESSREGPDSARNSSRRNSEKLESSRSEKSHKDDDLKSSRSETKETPRNQTEKTTKVVEDIFKTSARSEKDLTITKGSEDTSKKPINKESSAVDIKEGSQKDKKEQQVKQKDQNEQKPPTGKENSEQGSARKEDKDEKERPGSARLSETGHYGSQTSLRSGDKDIIGAPVPSPRKTISSRLSEDDVPKPSPRVTKGSKGKSPSTKSRDKLPDPKTLKDWVHCTSKGSFFYEEEEIVTHVYNLKLTEESFVYLSAYPIQEPSCLSLPGMEPVDTALFIFDSRGRLVTFTEQRDIKGKYGVQQKLSAGDYQILPYTTGCRFKQRAADQQDQMKEAKLVKRDKDEKIVITSAFRRALEDIFDLCDLDNNGTMSKDEFNWFNLRTSGEELGEDEWEVVEERTSLEEGEITKAGFIELNEMEAEDADGDVEDLWITLSSMGLNKALIMDEACPYRLDVYVQEKPELAKKRPTLKVTGIESLEKGEFAQEICTALMEKSQGEPVKVRNMKDLYMYTYRNEHKASIIIDNRSRSTVNIEIDCSRSKNVTSNRTELDYTLDVDPQQTAIAHHLLPKSELNEWTVNCTETIHK